MKLFGISYTTWKSVCDMYFSLNEGSKKAYLQWFPFTKLSKKDEETISGEDFYNTYIKTASLVLFSSVMHQSENFLQKGDGSFRDSSLIGPILYLTLQTSVYKGYKRDKIEMRGDRAEISDFPLYLNTVAGGLDCRDQTIGGFSFVVKIYAVPVVEIIG